MTAPADREPSAPVLVIGATGQIGHEAVRALGWLGPVAAPDRGALDLESETSIRAAVRRVTPAVVVNAAGYTAVDAAERDAARCARLNADAPAILAAECRRVGAILVHLSTDYVFDGAKGAPYVETDEPHPLGVYGETKLVGERAVQAAGGAYLVVRTSWVYAARGHNFALTVLRLAHERTTLAVVNDQVGAPTSASAVADGISRVLRRLFDTPDPRAAAESAAGVYHMTAAGSTTWYEFARVILADDPRAADQRCRAIEPISTAEYPAAARRPAYSVLDNGKLAARWGVVLSDWRRQWGGVAGELRRASGARVEGNPAGQ